MKTLVGKAGVLSIFPECIGSYILCGISFDRNDGRGGVSDMSDYGGRWWQRYVVDTNPHEPRSPNMREMIAKATRSTANTTFKKIRETFRANVTVN